MPFDKSNADGSSSFAEGAQQLVYVSFQFLLVHSIPCASWIFQPNSTLLWTYSLDHKSLQAMRSIQRCAWARKSPRKNTRPTWVQAPGKKRPLVDWSVEWRQKEAEKKNTTETKSKEAEKVTIETQGKEAQEILNLTLVVDCLEFSKLCLS